MKAKNTVDFNYLDGIYEGWLKRGGTAGDLQLTTAELQAEISFKAGYEQAVLENKQQCENCKREGIKEVVDWVNDKATNAPNAMLYVFLGTEWEAKLAEWGY